MLIIQLTGLSGAGKTTIATAVVSRLESSGFPTVLLDGDTYRQTISKDLGFTRYDRIEGDRRLGAAAWELRHTKKIAIIAAINPYVESRRILREEYNARLVWIHCPLEVLVKRDTKGLYKRALMKDDEPGKISNLTGVNDPFDVPSDAELVIRTDEEEVGDSVQRLFDFAVHLAGNGQQLK